MCAMAAMHRELSPSNHMASVESEYVPKGGFSGDSSRWRIVLSALKPGSNIASDLLDAPFGTFTSFPFPGLVIAVSSVVPGV